MRLDVLGATPPNDPQRVLALADQAYADYCSAGRETEQVDLGLAICTPKYPRVHDANRLFFARVPRGADAEELLADAERHYVTRGSTLQRLMLARLAPKAETVPLLELLRRRGWRELHFDIMRLDRASPLRERTCRIISARSAMRLYDAFAREAAASIEPQLADVSIERLDDPQYEALVAIVDGRVVARAALMTSGEVGLIEQVKVLDAYRRRGLGRAVVEAAIELCMRAQLKHVLLTVGTHNEVAKRLYASLGFTKLGEEVTFAAPQTLS